MDGGMCKEVFGVGKKAVVDVSVVRKVELAAIEDGRVELGPGVLHERDGHVAKSRRELGPAGSFDSGVAGLENTRVECMSTARAMSRASIVRWVG